MNVSPLQNVGSSEVLAMSSNDGLQQYAQASLVSVVLTAIAITVNHAYTLGVGAFLLGATLVVVPAVLLLWFRRTGSKAAFIGYLLMNLWLVVGFGLVEGLWDSTLRVFLGTLLASLSTSFPKPVIGSFGFEMSGIVTFIGSLFVLYYALRLVPWQPTVGQKAFLATSASLAVAATVGAYVATDRDTWAAPPNGIVKIGVIVPTDGPYALLGS